MNIEESIIRPMGKPHIVKELPPDTKVMPTGDDQSEKGESNKSQAAHMVTILEAIRDTQTSLETQIVVGETTNITASLTKEQMKAAQEKTVMEVKHSSDNLSNNRWRSLPSKEESSSSELTETEDEQLPKVTPMTSEHLG
ncbi:hypothetical protein NDU88_009524 [Pleurodeles waltl]|uniref:Uncharacterized protein n=1 Tax=Pleurodeles waltl TaxID=8319 RepID=A0AAV7RWH5_PLEWA|nr:hypothetical protein NDU88_009524 [Pleurodeles waltl]